jgi:predicted DNA-binding protein
VFDLGKRKINVTTMLEPEHYDQLTELSRETGKSISALIREAVEKWLSKEEQRLSEKEEKR